MVWGGAGYPFLLGRRNRVLEFLGGVGLYTDSLDRGKRPTICDHIY